MADILDRFMSTVREMRQDSLENPRTSLSNPAPWLWQALGASPTKAGVSVNQQTALGLSAFWACVKILGETRGSLPFITYRRTGDGSEDKERATDRPEYYLLHDQPNPQMTSMVLNELAMTHLCTWGNSYQVMTFNRALKVNGFWPLRPDKTAVTRKAGVLTYETTDTPDGKRRDYPPEEILHVPGMSFDGLSGLSPISVHRETIGHGLATEQYGSSFFGDGGRPGGVLEVPEELGDEAYNRLNTSFKEKIKDPHATVLLEGGTKYHVITVPPDDAQYIETRRFNISDMARIFRMPLAMLEEHDKAAAYASVEQFFLQFAVHTMRPWLVKFEQEINRKMFGVGQTSELFCEHLLDALLRGDLKSRYEAYHLALSDGWVKRDEVRRRENFNKLANGEGDKIFVPANMVPIDRALNPPKVVAPPAAGSGGGAQGDGTGAPAGSAASGTIQ